METTHTPRLGKIVVCVHAADSNHTQSVAHAIVLLYPTRHDDAGQSLQALGFDDHALGQPAYSGITGHDGCCTIDDVEPGNYDVYCRGFVALCEQNVNVEPGCTAEVPFEDPLNIALTSKIRKGDCEEVECDHTTVGQPLFMQAELALKRTSTADDVSELEVGHSIVKSLAWSSDTGTTCAVDEPGTLVEFTPSNAGRNHVRLVVTGFPVSRELATNTGLSSLSSRGAELILERRIYVTQQLSPPIRSDIAVTLNRSKPLPTEDQPLWVAIRNRSLAMSFNGGGAGALGSGGYSGFKSFIDLVLCDRTPSRDQRLERKIQEVGGYTHGLHAYELLKTAAEVFLLLECGVRIGPEDSSDDEVDIEESNRLGRQITISELRKQLSNYLPQGRLPYINRVLETAFPGMQVGHMHCDNVLSAAVDGPCLMELIWSYWHEEGMLVQTLNAISRRFQNIRSSGERDPLAHLEIAPLRPLNNILWGYIQSEQSRLTVKRRAYEYDHHYGLPLYGKAVPSLRTADSRSKFLEGFHNLLYTCAQFYRDYNDTTIIPDGFPLLNALKEVHLVLAQGAHNQFGDMPWTSRAEMLVQQWIMARPEIRDFLQSRAMVPYKEAWMPQVDTMKTLQGWSDVTVTHFRDLGVYGEQILLSVRYGDWIDVNDENTARNWAIYFRPEIQSYLHAYRAVTGVDLSNAETVDFAPPSVHLRKRLAAQVRSQ